MSGTDYVVRCRRCHWTLTDEDRDCPACGRPQKALIPLGEMSNGYAVQLYLDRDEHGPQIAVLRAILDKFQAQAAALTEIRTLAEAWADPHVGDEIIAVIDRIGPTS